MVEGDGVAQRVQPVEGNDSTRMFDSKKKKKEGLCVAVAVDGGDEECWGQETQRRWACQEREPKTVVKYSPDSKIRSVLLHQVTCKTKRSSVGYLGNGLLRLAGYRVNFADQP